MKDEDINKLRSKLAKQRNEIVRLTQLNEKLQEEKAKLLADLKWMRGETHGEME